MQKYALKIPTFSVVSDGTLHISYVQREYTDISYVFAAGPSGKSLEDAEIQFPPMLAEETAQTVEPVVLYQGQPLTEELDYIVLGDVEYNEAGTYTCYIRGVREYFGLIPCTYTVVENRVADWRLTLSDRVAMEFALSIDAETAFSTQVTVSYSGTTVSYAADTLPWDSAIGAYLLCVPLDAPQMTESVYLEITVDGQLYSKKSYTVRQYADYILDDANSYDETVKNLVRELVYYGGMAQLYFGYNTENLASSGIVGAAADRVPETADKLSICNQLEDLHFYGAGLVYRDRIGVRFYFMGDVSDCSFTANDQTYTPVLKDGLYYVEIGDVLPQELDAPITLTVTDASAETLTVIYSPILYIVRMHQKGNADLQALLNALYNYHLAAKAYQVQYS